MILRALEKTTTRLLVVGWYGALNIGDELVLKGAISLLMRHIKNSEITVVSHNPYLTRSLHNVKAIHFWNVFRLVISVVKAKWIIFGGGTVLEDKKNRTIPLWFLFILLLKILRKKIAMISHGFDVRRPAMIRLLRIILQLPDQISVRDSESLLFLQAKVRRKKASAICPDLAFQINAEKSTDQSCRSPKPKIGLNVRHSRWWYLQRRLSEERLVAVVSSVVDDIIEELDADVILVPFSISSSRYSDTSLSRKILSEVRHVDRTSIFEPHLGAQFEKGLVSEFRSFDIFVGMAYHSLVLSMMTNTPFIAVSYQAKCKAFMTDSGLQDLALDADEMECDVLCKKICDAWRNKQDIKKRLVIAYGLVKDALENCKMSFLTCG